MRRGGTWIQRWRVPFGFASAAVFMVLAKPNPMTLLIGAVVSLLAILFAGLFLGIYFPVMRVEASTLAELFGGDYEKYKEEVPLFFPRLTPFRASETGKVRFDGDLYMRYREYRAAMGLLAAWGVLLVKTYYLK